MRLANHGHQTNMSLQVVVVVMCMSLLFVGCMVSYQRLVDSLWQNGVTRIAKQILADQLVCTCSNRLCSPLAAESHTVGCTFLPPHTHGAPVPYSPPPLSFPTCNLQDMRMAWAMLGIVT